MYISSYNDDLKNCNLLLLSFYIYSIWMTVVIFMFNWLVIIIII